jgi:two-component system response regulator YesN
MKMSESNLRLKFRKENGISLGRFLRQNKLEIAKYRLEYTHQTVGEIARICGYDSQVSFSRFFKSKTGLSPLRWRKEHQTKIPTPEDPD